MGIINLDKTHGLAIHGPSCDGLALYARVDGKDESSVKKTEKWVKASEKQYNSPTNVRKIWICDDKVIIQLYQPIKGGTKNWREKPIVIPEGVTGVKGTGLAGIITPWVCSNVEEIYFDSIVFNGEVDPRFKIYGRRDEKGTGVDITKGLAAKVFTDACSSGVNSYTKIRERFPRLRVVSFISGLTSLIESTKEQCKTGIDFMEEELTNWIDRENVLSEVQRSRTYSIWKLEDNVVKDKYNMNFAIRAGIYKYDDEILLPYIEKYKEKLGEKRRGYGTTKSTTEDENYKELLSLAESCGQKAGHNMLKAALKVTYCEESKQFYKYIESNGSEKVKQLIK